MDYIQSCPIYQQAKSKHVKLPRLLQHLSVPEQAWHTISMDFIEGLPKSAKWDVIMVVVNKLTKYAHFLPLSHIYCSLSGTDIL